MNSSGVVWNLSDSNQTSLSLSLSLSLFFKVKNLKCLLTTIWSWMMDAVADFPLSLSVFLTRCDILFGKITKAKLPFTFIQSKKKKKRLQKQNRAKSSSSFGGSIL